MSCTETSGLSSGPPRYDIREDPPFTDPAAIAAGYENLPSVDRVGYVARRNGYDPEECIQKAPEDGEMGPDWTSPDGIRKYGICRPTAKGRRAKGRHMQ